MPKRVDAASAEVKLLLSAFLTREAVLAGTMMSAVMITDAATMVMVTAEAFTPATEANLLCKR